MGMASGVNWGSSTGAKGPLGRRLIYKAGKSSLAIGSFPCGSINGVASSQHNGWVLKAIILRNKRETKPFLFQISLKIKREMHEEVKD